MINFKIKLKHSAEHKLGISEIKHLLKEPAKLRCRKKNKKKSMYKANPLAALAQKSRKVYLAMKVKSLKKNPYLRGTTEITAQTSPITYVKSEQ